MKEKILKLTFKFDQKKLIQTKLIIMLHGVTNIKNHTGHAELELFAQDKLHIGEETSYFAHRKIFLTSSSGKSEIE